MTRDTSEIAVDLTPMIDCTFLLIVFFMLVLKMSSDEIEPVELPRAERAEKDVARPGRMIVNLARRGDGFRVIVGGEDLTPPREGGRWQVKGSRLERRLVLEADRRGRPDSERQVLIRADQDCPYEFVAMVMAALTGPDVRIFKIQLGAEAVGPGEGEGTR